MIVESLVSQEKYSCNGYFNAMSDEHDLRGTLRRFVKGSTMQIWA